jgi:hypothetical protein
VFGGLETVTAVASTAPVVYDSSRLWLAVRNDFSAEYSTQTDAAWSHYATSLRIVGRFALCAPMPSKSVRQLAVTAPGTEAKTTGAKTARAAA